MLDSLKSTELLIVCVCVCGVFADVNECEDSVRLEFPCVNARCVNTDGSYRCVCRRGYVMSRRTNHCVAA